ncbi:MAG: radical SAM family heme chaperone HemW [Bacteroidales bacterium]
MAGLYVHIPFCRQKCHYCNFYSLATAKFRDEVMAALPWELELQQHYFKGETTGTIYFGGGTPSLFRPGKIQEIIDQTAKFPGLEENAEITLEANPDDITAAWLDELEKTSVNRLSIGIQSFRDEELKKLNRMHSAQDALHSVRLAQERGYQNISIDLIYGIPGQTEEAWRENLASAIALHVAHISAYALTVEPHTALDVLIRKGKYPPVDDALAARHFEILSKFLTDEDYEHYEISNFALRGSYSRHNKSYWEGTKYLGIGPSAHSFDGNSRQWNVSNLQQYLEGIQQGKPVFEKETLTTAQRFNEYVMTAIRTMWGIDCRKVEDSFDAARLHDLLRQAEPYIQDGRIEKTPDHLVLTARGKFFADGIASALFADDD